MLLDSEASYVSVVSKVETLGYHELGKNERRFLEAFFDAADMLPVSQSTVAVAIRLRQRRRMSLGDALIAGTALSHGLRARPKRSMPVVSAPSITAQIVSGIAHPVLRHAEPNHAISPTTDGAASISGRRRRGLELP